MASTCVVCESKIGILETEIGVKVNGEEAKVHHRCFDSFKMNSQKFSTLPFVSTEEPALAANNEEPAKKAQRPSKKTATVRPWIIDTLAAVGWLLCLFMLIGGVICIFFAISKGVTLAFATGIGLIFAGMIQLSVFLGFAAIIEQLYEINVNTKR